MHEGSIAQSIIDSSLAIISKEKIERIHKIKISVGKLHAVVPDVLKNLFNIMKDEYPPLVQSQLEITELEVKINCKNCDASSRLEEPIFICPECGSTEIDMIQGNELHIMSIEGESD